MLQKTRAEGVVDTYLSFIEKYPDFIELSQAKEDDLLDNLRPIGLYVTRARNFIRLSKKVVEEFGGTLPKKKDEILSLPGVGIYMTHAVLSVCHGKSLPVVDTNVKRIYERFFSLEIKEDVRRDKSIWHIANQIIPKRNCREFNWSLLDLSALVCKKGNPKCPVCPLGDDCDLAAVRLSAKGIS